MAGHANVRALRGQQRLNTSGTLLVGHNAIREWGRARGDETDEFVRTDAGWRFAWRTFETWFA
jgi:hypothetical protein